MPGANSLAEDHTLDHLRDELRASRLSECSGWKSVHAQDHEPEAERARRIPRQHVAAEPPGVLTPDHEAQIDEIVEEAPGRLEPRETGR